MLSRLGSNCCWTVSVSEESKAHKHSFRALLSAFQCSPRPVKLPSRSASDDMMMVCGRAAVHCIFLHRKFKTSSPDVFATKPSQRAQYPDLLVCRSLGPELEHGGNVEEHRLRAETFHRELARREHTRQY